MKTLTDLTVGDHYISLNKLTDKIISDLYCGITNEWGDALICVYGIKFSDGTYSCVQGEHDIVYIEDDELVPQEQLELLLEEAE